MARAIGVAIQVTPGLSAPSPVGFNPDPGWGSCPESLVQDPAENAVLAEAAAVRYPGSLFPSSSQAVILARELDTMLQLVRRIHNGLVDPVLYQ